MKYEICADEAWTHTSPPLNRYWCFYGGVHGSESDIDRLETELIKVRTGAGRPGEVKWANVSAKNIDYYNALLEVFFQHLRDRDLHYRQFFTSREFVPVVESDEPEAPTSLDVQFKLYYQFLKHSFGLQHLPAVSPETPHEILLRLDEHSSAKHKRQLKQFAEMLPAYLHPQRIDLQVRVTYVHSEDFMRLQVCDLLMGAAGSHGNKKHEIRKPGVKGMHETQKVRYELAQRIYKELRLISCKERDTQAFNWFESTGRSTPSASLTDKVRIWKFMPKKYMLDKGWRNDHLGKGGRYLGPVMTGEILSADGRGR